MPRPAMAQPVSPGPALEAAVSISPTRSESPTPPQSEMLQHELDVLESISGTDALAAAKRAELAKAVVEQRERLPVFTQLRIVEGTLVVKSAALQRRATEHVRLQAEMEVTKAAGKKLQAEIKELEKDKLALLSKQQQQRTDVDAAAGQAVATKVEQREVSASAWEADVVLEELKAVITLVRGSPPTPDCADENADEHANMDVRNVQVKRDSQGAQQGGSEESAGRGPKKHNNLGQQ